MKPNFKVKDNPLPWLEWVLNGADHTNFFENRVTEYEVAGLKGDWDDAYAA
jgi:ribonucleoside-diphosphate reductase beta chain